MKEVHRQADINRLNSIPLSKLTIPRQMAGYGSCFPIRPAKRSQRFKLAFPFTQYTAFNDVMTHK
ncbi:MAG: hypothetical protein ABFS05_13485, partial [Bacteroidota bacterium]